MCVHTGILWRLVGMLNKDDIAWAWLGRGKLLETWSSIAHCTGSQIPSEASLCPVGQALLAFLLIVWMLVLSC